MADHAVCVGPPPAAESYLRIPSVDRRGARRPAARPCIPGYGFLAENPAFVEACVDNDLVFVGPPADVMARWATRSRAKQAMRAADVPTVPGTEGATTRRRGARGAADEIGYPGAAQGGGGRRRQGHAARRTRPTSSRTPSAPPSAEAEAAFGDGTLYVEKALVARAARRDPGALRHARQRAHARRARVLDPAPPPEADRGVAVGRAHAPRRARQMEAAAERACRAVGYRNAGTFEFLLGPDGQLLLHRAERAAPGRAPGDGAVHRHRPRARAAARRRRRAARRHRPRAAARPRDRDPPERRGSRARLLPVARARRALPARAGARACASTRSSRRARSSRRTTTR